ncbi:MAG: hypothetical protein A3J46_04400 [Candidatus Yanofskybacteria bacterium RIFCSPHIGHO2_02_FULL_41_11]|uniref:Uncharacterized protein n=1 Tax=Candidatus Yanofskybacteria bacterium RIFCSPHIGHO2_02_FULL_41_11 TaxID=1802675 RepID=A0A1F8F6L1_9BACT|nr:MAG: hypothetical protein A3J46_04400 [Candidatus Yanofskybacteria bacterium RIFCSPHIGHO2_02_FULL_41_11]
MKRKYLNISSIKKPLKEIEAVMLLTLAALVVLAIWAIFKLPIEQPMATLVIDMGNQKRVFEGQATGDMTILDTLVLSSEAGDISLQYGFNEKKEAQIISLDGYSAYDPVEFMFFLNSKAVNASEINKLSVQPGDTIKVEVKRYDSVK